MQGGIAGKGEGSIAVRKIGVSPQFQIFYYPHVHVWPKSQFSRLKSAGAILLAVTNVPEGIMWGETANTLFGRTNNPYDTRRSPGGSSGGEAALIASAGSIFGIGSDYAGSIRGPAAFCGVYGLMPSPGGLGWWERVGSFRYAWSWFETVVF